MNGLRAIAAGIGILALTAGTASADSFPERPITIVNPYSAGGPADFLARTVGGKMSEILGQPVVVESRPGAGTAIAANHVAQSEPDGYTVLIAGSPTHVITPAIRKEAGYDGIEDFKPIGRVATVPNVLVVNKGVEASTVDELIALAKKNPGQMTFASVGVGSLPHLSGLLFQQSGGIELTHVPYKGAAPAVVDLVAQNVDLAFLNAPPLLPHIKEGSLKALGVAKPDRADQLPDVPTMEEAGMSSFDMSTWYALSVPAATPQPVIDTLADALSQALADPEVQEALATGGAEATPMAPAEFEAFLAEDAERTLGLLKAAGVEAQ